MDATTTSPTDTAFAAEEPAKRFLDPSAEWRDCANQWDVSEVYRARGKAPAAKSIERGENGHQKQ
jgi:hypothetical protein